MRNCSRSLTPWNTPRPVSGCSVAQGAGGSFLHALVSPHSGGGPSHSFFRRVAVGMLYSGGTRIPFLWVVPTCLWGAQSVFETWGRECEEEEEEEEGL